MRFELKMEIGDILKKCEPEDILITSVDAIEGLTWKKAEYWINKDISEEEQIVTLIHELLHHLPRYQDGHGHLCGSYYYPNHELHRRLEEEAVEIYHSRPEIKALLLEKLELAKIQKEVEI